MENMGPGTKQATMISVVGGSFAGEEMLALAEEVGAAIARVGAVLVCGGLGGVMEAACRGASREGGTSLGFLPGNDRGSANPYVTLAVPTGMGLMRNDLVVLSGQAVIAVDGGYGTLNEVTCALNRGIPVVSLRSWDLGACGVEEGDVHSASSAQEAVELALELARGG